MITIFFVIGFVATTLTGLAIVLLAIGSFYRFVYEYLREILNRQPSLKWAKITDLKDVDRRGYVLKWWGIAIARWNLGVFVYCDKETQP